MHRKGRLGLQWKILGTQRRVPKKLGVEEGKAAMENLKE